MLVIVRFRNPKDRGHAECYAGSDGAARTERACPGHLVEIFDT